MDGAEHNSKGRLEMLKGRTKRCVCKFCGGKLRLKRIIFSQYEDARIEIFCPTCNRIEFGVEPEIYQSARFLVEETGFNYFQDMDDNERTKQMNTAKVSEMMSWVNMSLGVIDKEGFCVPVKSDAHFLGKCLTLTDADLAEDGPIEEP